MVFSNFGAPLYEGFDSNITVDGEEFNVEFMRIKKIYGESRFSKWLKKFELWCCRGSDLIFTVSEVDRKTLIDFKIFPEKIVTISGVNSGATLTFRVQIS